MQRKEATMSRHHRNGNRENAKIAVMKAVAQQLTANDIAIGSAMNHLVERTGESIILLVGYITYRMEQMNDGIEGTSPFVQKLRNRSNQVVRSCEDFLKVLEPYIKDNKKEADYMTLSDAVQNALDSFFDGMHIDEPETTAQVKRRAKLRYHDPYKEHVKECTEAFEDGYEKGYTDCVRDVQRELIKLKDVGDAQAVINIVDGQVDISPVGKEVKP